MLWSRVSINRSFWNQRQRKLRESSSQLVVWLCYCIFPSGCPVRTIAYRWALVYRHLFSGWALDGLDDLLWVLLWAKSPFLTFEFQKAKKKAWCGTHRRNGDNWLSYWNRNVYRVRFVWEQFNKQRINSLFGLTCPPFEEDGPYSYNAEGQIWPLRDLFLNIGVCFGCQKVVVAEVTPKSDVFHRAQAIHPDIRGGRQLNIGARPG